MLVLAVLAGKGLYDSDRTVHTDQSKLSLTLLTFKERVVIGCFVPQYYQLICLNLAVIPEANDTIAVLSIYRLTLLIGYWNLTD